MNDVKTILHFDEINKKLVVERKQDVAPFLKASHERMATSRSDWKGDLHHVMHVPNIVIEQYFRETGVLLYAADEKEWARFLNNPDYAYLRTKAGRV